MIRVLQSAPQACSAVKRHMPASRSVDGQVIKQILNTIQPL